MKVHRVEVASAKLAADNNIRYQYPIHSGTWVRHPAVTCGGYGFCRYALRFRLMRLAVIDLHVSADSRFELFCDDVFVGKGPDRCDLDHWSFHTYRVHLDAGDHELRAETSFFGVYAEVRPFAQTCIEPGFVLYSPTDEVDLNTGSAPWRSTKLDGVRLARPEMDSFYAAGADAVIDAGRYFADTPAVAPVVVCAAGNDEDTGTIQPRWKLYPTPLPEQLRRRLVAGRIRAVADGGHDDPLPSSESREAAGDASKWQALIEDDAPLTVASGTRVTAIWDLEGYHCAYLELSVSGGAGSEVEIEWAESCFLHPRRTDGQPDRLDKGHRDEITGKYFRGCGDTFLPDGPPRVFRAPWWRAGRYVRITVTTGDEPIDLLQLKLTETRMPLENEGTFTSSDPGLNSVLEMSVRGIQMCAHETYMDCPYFEQMMYVGDTRLQMLCAYVMSGEDRLNRRALELFDWSRRETGFVLERYPSQPSQLSCTFSMIWVLMVRDYAWWRNDRAFVRQLLKGVRCLLEEFKSIAGDETPLLPALPGWSFVDWRDGLSFVNPPGNGKTHSALVNLLFLHTLDAAADIEESFGERHLAGYNRRWCDRLTRAIDEAFWDDKRSLFADDQSCSQFSEHAQCLALLSGRFEHRHDACFASLIAADDLIQTTVYFSHYLFETFAEFGRGDLILDRLSLWKEMVAAGLKTPAEMPEPTRSDCHAWGSHPMFHMHASLAGVRPASPGFGSVRIRPLPGSLTWIKSETPHPAGEIKFSMVQRGQAWDTLVELPDGVEGVLEWKGCAYALVKRSTHLLPL